MRFVLLFQTFFVMLALNSGGQQSPKWDHWYFLIGEWKGEGSGQPGQGDGIFSFYTDLNQNILVRKSHTEFPATGNRPAAIHDDLMIEYPENEGIPSKAVYFDNEGHVINYSVAYANNSIVLTGEKKAGMPVFRLTYTPLDKDLVNTKFELSQDGDKFITYIEGNSKRVK